MKTIKYFVVLLLLVFQTAVRAQGNNTDMKLNQLIDIALENNYLLKAADNRVAISESEVEFFRKNFLPEAGVSVNASFWKWLMPNKQKLLGSQLTDVYAEISLKQTLFDGGKNSSQKEIARLSVRNNKEAWRSLRQAIVYNVAYSWFELQKADQTITIHENALEQLKNHLLNVQALYNIGKASNVDVLKIKVQIAAGKKAIADAKSNFEQKQIQFNKWLGEDRYHYQSGNSDAVALWEQWQNAGLDKETLLASALLHHPDLAQFELKIAAKRREESLYRADSMPNINAFSLFSWEDNYIPFGNSFNYNIGIGISYKMPFFKGSAYKDKMLESRLAALEMENSKNQLIVELSASFGDALSQLGNRKNEEMANREIIALSRETLDNALLKYNAGQGNIIDVLDAQSILTNTEISHYQSIIEYLQLIAKINFLTGQDKKPFAI